jgi:hypothetical protein
MRFTPFGLVFADMARDRFPTIATALEREGSSPADRDRFVLIEPVARMLHEIVPETAEADALEAHLLLLHHAYLHWASGGWVYDVGEETLRRAMAEGRMSSQPPHPALYLQLPELRIWGSANPAGGGASEPLDGMFVSTTTTPGSISVLAIFGMRPDRPGFSAIGLEGRADEENAADGGNEIEIAAAREDGSAPFGPMLAGGSAAGLHSVANAGELLLLACRILAQLPREAEAGQPLPLESGELERVVRVE